MDNIGNGFLKMMGMESQNIATKEKVINTIQQIDVDNLIPHEKNLYIVEDTSELEKAIEAQGGVKQNLIVTPCGGGKYRIISGHRRRQSVKNLLDHGANISHCLPCKVEKYNSESEEVINLILMNSTTRILTEWEKIEQYKQLKENITEYCASNNIEIKDKRELFAKLLNTNPSKIGKYNAIENNLTDEYKAELKANSIGVHTAYEASSLPQEAQKELHQEKGAKTTLNDVREKKAEFEQKEDLRKLEKATGQIRIAGCVVDDDVEDDELVESVEDIGLQKAGDWFVQFLESLINQRKHSMTLYSDRNKFHENCIAIMNNAIEATKIMLKRGESK